MKIFVLVAALVTLVQGRPEAGNSNSSPLSRPIVVADVNESDFTTGDEIAGIQKHIYVHAPAPELNLIKIKPKKPISIPTPEKHYKLVFIKAPTPPTPIVPEIPVIPQNEEKTLVYVLSKKPEDPPEIKIPTAAPTQPSKPEVYFIRYKNKKEGGSSIENTQKKEINTSVSSIRTGIDHINTGIRGGIAGRDGGVKGISASIGASQVGRESGGRGKSGRTGSKKAAASSQSNRIPKTDSVIDEGFSSKHINSINVGLDNTPTYTVYKNGGDFSIELNGRPSKRIKGSIREENLIDVAPNRGVATAPKPILSGSNYVSKLSEDPGSEVVNLMSMNAIGGSSSLSNIGQGKDIFGRNNGGLFDTYNSGKIGSRPGDNIINQIENDDKKFSVIQKHIYVHVPPPEPTEYRPRKPITVPPPQTHYKIIFIKAPTLSTLTAPQIPVIPQNEEKTLVYVLHKKPEDAPRILIPTAAPTQPAKPEVYFIRYKAQKEQSSDKVPASLSNSYGSPGNQSKSH